MFSEQYWHKLPVCQSPITFQSLSLPIETCVNIYIYLWDWYSRKSSMYCLNTYLRMNWFFISAQVLDVQNPIFELPDCAISKLWSEMVLIASLIAAQHYGILWVRLSQGLLYCCFTLGMLNIAFSFQSVECK